MCGQIKYWQTGFSQYKQWSYIAKSYCSGNRQKIGKVDRLNTTYYWVGKIRIIAFSSFFFYFKHNRYFLSTFWRLRDWTYFQSIFDFPVWETGFGLNGCTRWAGLPQQWLGLGSLDYAFGSNASMKNFQTNNLKSAVKTLIYYQTKVI